VHLLEDRIGREKAVEIARRLTTESLALQGRDGKAY